MIQKSEDIGKLAVALLKTQKEIEGAHKNATNPFFKSKYADISAVIGAVKGPLNDNGITFLQAVDSNESGPVIDTILLHESGQFISSRTPVYCSKQNDPQALGSGITYSKRYALQALMGLPTADDDGNAASRPPASKKPATEPPAEPDTPPTPSPASQKIIEQAIFNFETQHKDDIAEGFAVDTHKFFDAVWAWKKKWPEAEGSIPKIVEAIKLTDVLTEVGKPK